MGLAFVPLYIEYLGMEAYGLIGFFAVMQAWLVMLDMGMTPTLNREMARFTAGARSPQSINDLLRSLEIITIGIATTSCILVWLVSDYLADDWFNAEKLPNSVIAQAISIMGVVASLRFVESIYRGSLLGLQQQVWYNIVNAAIATLRHGGVLVVLVLISPSIQIFFLWQIAVSIVAIGALAYRVHRELPRPPFVPRFEFVVIVEVWKFAGGVMAMTLLAIILTQIDKLLISRLLPLEAFGYYTLAASVAGVLYVVTAPVTNAYYPRMVELFAQGDTHALVSIYHQAGQLVTVLTAPAAMLLCFFPGKVIFVWSGDPNLVENTAPVLSLIAVGVFLNCLMYMPAQLQLAGGWVSLAIKTNLVAVIVLVPAMFWVVPLYGVIGAAWIWLTLNTGYVLVAIHLMHRRLLPNDKWRWYFSDVLLPVIGVAGIMLLAELFQPENFQNRLHDLVFLMLVGTIALVIASSLADQLRSKLFSLLKNKVVDAW